jgi:uncharacterized protein
MVWTVRPRQAIRALLIVYNRIMTSNKNVKNQPEPVTVVVTWRVTDGKEELFRSWVHSVTQTALTFPGHLGVTTLKQPGSDNIYHSIVRFDNRQHGDAWFNSQERAAWVKKLEGIATQQKSKLGGLETWFELPGSTPPPRWKMVVATFIAVYPISLLLNEFASPYLTSWNVFLRALLFPIVLPILLTYLIMPFITQKLLKRWLYPSAK